MRYNTFFLADYIARFERDPSPGRAVQHQVIPGSWGGRRTRDNTVYMNHREALHAYARLWKLAPTKRVRQRYARFLWARLHAPEFDHLKGKSAWLLRAVSPWVRGANSLHAAPVNATLWHIDGRRASGNQPALAQQTGLDSRRVRDLVCGRRPYASGWTTSPELAAQGERKAGRPAAKPFIFF